MAVTQDQINLIHEALEALGARHGGADTLGRDVNAGLSRLVGLVNGSGGTPINYNPATGYTPQLGQELLSRIQTLKNSGSYTAITEALDLPFGGEQVAQGLLRTQASIPNAIKNDPQKLVDLVNDAPAIVAALDAAHAEGAFSLAPQTVAQDTPDATSTGTEPEEPQEPEEPPMTVIGAVAVVETALKEIAPQLNSTLDNFSNNSSSQGGLASIFQSLTQGGILDHRIPEISQVDGNFDLRSQASLQAFMIFLSDPMVMNLPGDNDWYYTPAKGEMILANLDNLKNKIKQMMGEEEYNRQNLDDLLTRDKLEPLIEALDFLANQDPSRIAQQLLFNQGNIDTPSYTFDLFQNLISEPESQEERDYQATYGAHRIAGMATHNPDMLKLMDVLTREYSGQYGLMDLMPDLEGTDALNDIDGTIPRDQLLANLYKAARAKHEENGHGETLDNDMFVMISTINTLPFGSNEYRRNYERMMRDAIKAAGEISDPDEAARIFAERVTAGMAQLEAQNGIPQHTHPYERDAPSWKPGLENFTITSNGQTITAADIAVFYDNYHIMVPGNPFQESLQTDYIAMHGHVTFKDDNGNVYVAGIDKESMVFSIEKIDVERLQELYADENLTIEQRRAEMIQDPGFALMAGIRGALGAENDLMHYRAFDNVQAYHVISENYQQDVDAIRQQIDQEQAERDSYIPPYANSVAASENDTPSATDRFGSVARPPTVFSDTSRDSTQILSDLEELRDFANKELNSSPRVIMAHETGIMDMLRRNDVRGPDGRQVELPVGNYPGVASLRVEHLDLPPEGTTGQMLAYFDFDAHTVKVVPMPDYLVDPERRAELKSMAENGPDSAEFMREIQQNYPELFAAVQEYRTGGYGGGIVVDGSPIGLNEYTQFKASLHGFIRSIERDIRDHAYVEPVEPRTADTFWDNMRNAKDGVLNTPRRIGRHIDERYGDFDPEAAAQGVAELPERAADGFVSVVKAIGSRAEELADQVTDEREKTGLSHQVHGIATGAHDPGLKTP